MNGKGVFNFFCHYLLYHYCTRQYTPNMHTPILIPVQRDHQLPHSVNPMHNAILSGHLHDHHHVPLRKTNRSLDLSKPLSPVKYINRSLTPCNSLSTGFSPDASPQTEKPIHQCQTTNQHHTTPHHTTTESVPSSLISTAPEACDIKKSKTTSAAQHTRNRICPETTWWSGRNN